MGVDVFPPPTDDSFRPLTVVSKNWTPGSAGFMLDETASEIGKLKVRQPITLTSGAALLGALAFGQSYGGGVDPRGTQIILKCDTYVNTPNGFIPFWSSFPSACWIVVACFGDTPGVSSYNVGSISASGFYFLSGSGVGHRVNYLAVGY